MKKQILFVFASVFMLFQVQAQKTSYWTSSESSKGKVATNKGVDRPSFPQEFKLYGLNISPLREILFSAIGNQTSKKAAIVFLPNIDGQIEEFEIHENSNFEPALQAQFPEIRAYSGKGITDKYATLKLSISPQGIQTMIFRTDKENEFMEPYSADGSIYAVYNSARDRGSMPFTCRTEDQTMAQSVKKQVSTNRSSNSELLTFKLALSCTGEYGAFFGGAAGALAQMNATMTRVNGVFEKDFTIHMNMVSNAAVIYTNSATDPYSDAVNITNWNAELQATLTANIGEANYDIGHLFGASGGGGNAGCIGCVCVDGSKGSGITSPGSGSASGDTFDIDYVAHEMGHQFGANHTHSFSTERTGVNMEPGSGSTIMGYAGITGQDVQMNSNDYFHVASIIQVEDNMVGKTCPTRTPIANIAPVVNAGANYTIPKSTPFQLTGTGTDANGNALTYCWEQFNSATAAQTAAASAALNTKVGGPNWRSYSPTASPSRYFPNINSVVANSLFTTATSNDVPPIKTEYLSSVARTLTFVLTARDNVASGGLTDSAAMGVTVNATAGPFTVSVPSAAALSYAVGTNLAVTWAVAGTTANGVNAANVDIYLSTDGGFTYPIQLASGVPNDGSETITIPNNIGNTNRIMVKGYNHIFFDISNSNFSITAPASSFSLAYSGTAGNQNVPICQGSNASYVMQYTPLAGFAGTTTFTATGAPAGTTVTFTPATRTTAGPVTVAITNTATAILGNYPIVVTGTSGATTRTATMYLTVLSGTFGVQSLSTPANLAVGMATSPSFTWPANAAATSYDFQLATDAAFTTIIASGNVTTTTASVSGLNLITDYFWRVMPKNAACSGTFSAGFKFTTGQSNCTYNYSNNTNLIIADGTGANVAGAVATKTIVVPGTVTGNLNAVEVGLSFTHDYVQDLIIELMHPDGTIIKLMNRSCDEGATVAGATYSFNFTNSASVQLPAGSCLTPAPITGNVKPADAITVFNGKAASGTWTLRAADWYNGDTGSISNWSLNLCVAEALSTNEFNGFENFSLFPNPNTGNFTVRFTSGSTNDIKINVHDMRGRQVYENSFSNTGAFNQNINLDKVQAGIYLVTISDGAKKTVKRIVVQ